MYLPLGEDYVPLLNNFLKLSLSEQEISLNMILNLNIQHLVFSSWPTPELQHARY